MKMTFDPAKNASNLAKHGVSLALAADLEWDLAWVREDTREAYGEARLVGFVPIVRTLYCVAFTEDDEIRRIISLRKATPREVRDYARHI